MFTWIWSLLWYLCGGRKATDGSYAGGAALYSVITASVVSDILKQFKISEVFAVSDRSTKAKHLGNTVLEKIGEDVEAMREFSQELNEHLLHVVDDNQGCSKLTRQKKKFGGNFVQRNEIFFEQIQQQPCPEQRRSTLESIYF